MKTILLNSDTTAVAKLSKIKMHVNKKRTNTKINNSNSFQDRLP